MNNRHVMTGQKREQNVKSWITSEVPETAPTRACRENTTRSLKLERRPQEDSPALILKVAPYTTTARLDSPAAVIVMSRRKELPPTLKELKPNLSRTNSLVEAYSKAFVLACCLRCSNGPCKVCLL